MTCYTPQCETSLAKADSKNNVSIALLSLAAFVIVTTEFIIIGLIPTLARDLNISISMAGQLVTAFAVIVVFAGPPLTALFSRTERRRLFTWILVAFALSNIAVALAPNYWTVLIARILPAALLPVFWGVGSDAASKLASQGNSGKAISQVYFGVTAALLFGLPLGTVLGDAVGWRGAFWALAALSLAMAVLLRSVMPELRPDHQTDLKSQVATLLNRFFLANLALSFAIFTAIFGAYTYLADMLERSGGVEPAHVGWWLMGFGTVGLLGNYLAGRLVDNYAVKANILFCLMLGLGAASAAVFAKQPLIFAGSLVLWGVAHTALFPLGQIRVINAAKSAKALAGTLNISACNSGIAAGALLGGWAINISGITIAVLGASVLIVLCGVASPLVERMRPAT